MTSGRETLAIAIDGGGTRCRIAACTAGEPLVVEAGSVNVSTDFAGALAELRRGLDEAVSKLGSTLEDLSRVPAYIGVAGMTGARIADRMAAELPFVHVKIEDDRPSALRGALGERDGIVVHCGTGSFAGAQCGGAMRLVGGWGPRLGDEASAQWVGRRALSRSLDTIDEKLAATALTEMMLEKFGEPSDIVAFAGGASPADLGALAVQVTRHAADGDEIARAILREAVEYIVATSRSLGWAPGLPICLTGGIGPHYREYLPADLQAEVAEAQGAPLQGAMSLAEDFRREVEDERR